MANRVGGGGRNCRAGARNERDGSGHYKLIGRARVGHLVTIVVARTAVPGRWRPVTGRGSPSGCIPMGCPRRSTDAEKDLYGS